MNNESPMAIAKKNAWSERIAIKIASQCLRWTKNGALLDVQRAAALIRAGVAERAEKENRQNEPA